MSSLTKVIWISMNLQHNVQLNMPVQASSAVLAVYSMGVWYTVRWYECLPQWKPQILHRMTLCSVYFTPILCSNSLEKYYPFLGYELGIS
jgi:hypothetical protein